MNILNPLTIHVPIGAHDIDKIGNPMYIKESYHKPELGIDIES